MGRFNPLTWLDRSGVNTGKPRISGANLNRLEQGVADATQMAAHETGATPGTEPLDKDERVEWTREDGALVARVAGHSSPGANQRGQLQLEAYARETEKSQVDMQAHHNVGQADASSVIAYIQNAPYAATRKRRVAAQMTDDAGNGVIVKDFLRSDGTSDFVQKADVPATNVLVGEAWRRIGAAGNPAFVSSWANYRDVANGEYEYVAFYKDPFGIVHLKGQVVWNSGAASAADSLVFTLPAGYRPNRRSIFNVIHVAGAGQLRIDGAVTPGGANAGGVRFIPAFGAGLNQWVALEGISFRAGDGTQS